MTDFTDECMHRRVSVIKKKTGLDAYLLDGVVLFS